MKNEDQIKDAIESVEKAMNNIDYIISLGTVKNPIVYEERFDILRQMVEEMEKELDKR